MRSIGATAGLSLDADAAADKAALFAAATKALDAIADSTTNREDPPSLFWVPGRIEFLGKHTDYAGGRSLLCAVDRGICLATRSRRDARVRVHDAQRGEMVETAIDESVAQDVSGWAIYPSVVARRLARNFPGARIGADIAFASDLPIAAGISSSSALVVSIFLALSTVNSLDERDDYREVVQSIDDLAGYLGAIENGLEFGSLAVHGGVGTLGGCEDQTAILCGRRDALIQYSFCPVRLEDVVPIPPGHRFVVAASGVAAEKTGSALQRYNLLSRRAQAAAAAWRASSGLSHATLGEAVRGASPDVIRAALMVRAPAGFTVPELLERFEQFYLESEVLVPRTADALRRHDLPQLGALVDQSQAAAERLLGNQIAETIMLARTARELGAVAASAFGAGFGGSVWALVDERHLTAFLDEWRERYRRAFPAHGAVAQFFGTRAGSCAARLAGGA